MLPLVLSLFFLFTNANALLTPAHFASSFLLNLSSPLLLPSSSSCGSNLGSDEVRLDPTATLPGTDSLPVSPAFYYRGGQRCRRRAPDHAAFFILHPGLHDSTLTGKFKDVADAIEDVAGSDSIVTAQGAHLRESASRKYVSISAILPSDAGARVEKVAGELTSGPVLCGQRQVSGVVYARAGRDVDVKDGDGKVVLRMLKERMYAAVATEEDVCFYSGFTRAPEGEVVLEGLDDVEQEEGEQEGGSRVALWAGVAGIAALAVVLAGVFGTLYLVARRKEKEEEREESKDIEAEEESEMDTFIIEGLMSRSGQEGNSPFYNYPPRPKDYSSAVLPASSSQRDSTGVSFPEGDDFEGRFVPGER